MISQPKISNALATLKAVVEDVIASALLKSRNLSSLTKHALSCRLLKLRVL